MPRRRIHCLQHAPGEGPANIEVWARERGHDFSVTHVYRDPFPKMEDFDLLIVLGGAMGAYEEAKHPWLVSEKAFLKQVISSQKKILGICLGAQILAEVNGGKVYPGEFLELGWYEVEFTEAAKQEPLFAGFPPRFTAFHWHGDTFEMPTGAIRLAESQVYLNQGFKIGTNQLALQFHPEVNEDLLLHWVESSKDDWPEGRFVQRMHEILHQAERIERTYRILGSILDRLTKD